MKMLRGIIRVHPFLAALLLVSALASLARAGADPVNRDSHGVALRGYDAVAYHTRQEAVHGEKAYAYEWNGAIWYFTSAGNRELFAENPERYAPQFGGYCAWAVGHDYIADGDPTAWSIVDGKLFLNYNKQVQALWLEEIPQLIEKGNGNWPKLLLR